MKSENIDGGKAFDWGRTSEDYGKFRDIYPEEVYRRLLENNVGTKGQNVLDVGTGTAVIPRNMYKYGAHFVATDISENQIAQAKKLSEGMDIELYSAPAEQITNKPDGFFDCITAFTCFFYFDHEKFVKTAVRSLKNHGRLAVGYLAWLPFEDEIAGKSEKLILKYNPLWSGSGETRRSIFVPEIYNEYFTTVSDMVFDVKIPFTRESWNGRMRACRGVGASLSEEEIKSFEKEHMKMLSFYPESFEILHTAAIKILERR